MKKLFITLALLAGIFTSAVAQKITYQVIVRDNNQQLVVNTMVKTTIHITFVGSAAYDTTIIQSTNMHGLLALQFGNNSFYTRNWKDATIRTTVVNNANNSIVYVHEQERPISAVPYALTVSGQSIQQYLDDNGYIDGDSIHNDIKDTANALRGLITAAGGDITSLANRVNTFNTHVCDSVAACLQGSNNALSKQIIKTVSDTIADGNSALNQAVDSIANHFIKNNKISVKLNGVLVDDFTLNQNSDGVIDIEVKEITDRYTATNEQTTFTLSQTPKANFSVKFYINGVMVGDALENTSGKVITVNASTKVVTYNPTNNEGYKLCAGDRIQIGYSY